MSEPKPTGSDPSRRAFLQTVAAAATVSIVPRHVLGGPGHVPPSEKIHLAYIGTGTQGLREMPALLACPDIRVVAVCDPCRETAGYRDWSRNGLLDGLRQSLGRKDWRAGTEGTIPGGLDAGKSYVDAWYAGKGAGGSSCAAYADVRELFAGHKDLDAVKIMTPDHLHGVLALAAMRRGKHVMTHKPMANRLQEGRRVVEAARATGVATALLAWDANRPLDQVLAWVRDGALGTLREIHNWSNRPVWPQYAAVPTERPPVPKGFDWDLWLGPEADRPYHPAYTHMVFRGWYDFGGGSMADMGHYSLWSVFRTFDLLGPTRIEPVFAHACTFQGSVAATLANRDSFPLASRVGFRFPARGSRPQVDLFWYDGGFRPPTPDELEEDGQALEAEGMLFVGDKGKVLASFHGSRPRLIPRRRLSEVAPAGATGATGAAGAAEAAERGATLRDWVRAVRGGPQPAASFLNAGPLTEAVNLYAVALRTGKTLRYDPASARVTNVPEANALLARGYRKGWDPDTL